jgi:hypothetical protein
MTTTTEVTWANLVAAEPRLAALLAEARSIRDDRRHPTFCANAVWYGYRGYGHGLKARLEQLVGWDRKGHQLLGTEAAYDLAYDTIYSALPNCRQCGCA